MTSPAKLPPPGGQRGTALLTVLLLVSVMAVIAAVMLERVHLATRLAANSSAITQARLLAVAAEALVTERITALVAADAARTVDRLGLLGREQPLAFDAATVTVRVEDAGNCFNLNSVVAGDNANFADRPLGRRQFTALMNTLEIDAGTADTIARSLSDWIDSDQLPQSAGAEDGYYAQGELPYRTPDRLVADISELRAVRGVTPEIYDRLRPWICALPLADLSPVNVNTLRLDQARLLAMLAPEVIPPDRARAVIAGRPVAGFGSTVDFWRPFAEQSQIVGTEIETQVKVRSRWFALATRVAIGATELEARALVDAQMTPGRVVQRSWGEDS